MRLKTLFPFNVALRHLLRTVDGAPVVRQQARRTRRSGILAALAAGGVSSGVMAQGVEVAELDLETWSQRQLGNSMSAIMANLVGSPEIVEPELILAFGLAEIMVETSPDNETAWRRLYQIATTLQRDVPGAAEARRRAIEAIVRFDPDDDVMRLRLLLDRIEGRPTAEARIEAYESLLTEENIRKLGKPASARIAFDLALLQMRVGDQVEGVENAIRALELDPTFPRAADMAAGLFRSTVTNPIDEAELLAIAFSASPLDDIVARALGQIVLRSGAYENAADIIELAMLLTPEDATFQSILNADRALALWGVDRTQEALETLERADRKRTLLIKQDMIRDGADPFDVESLTIPASPEAALVEAVITSRTGSRMDRDSAVEALFASFQFERSQLDQRAEQLETSESGGELPRESIESEIRTARARIILDEAWARAWFGWQPDANSGRLSLDELLEQAKALGVLEPEQQSIIEGWWAIHREEYAEARSRLGPAAERSPYALAGLALLEEVEGQSKQAARRYLAVYRDRPGDLIGLWSRSRLAALLGVSVPVTEEAKLMAEMLRSTFATGVGRAIRDPKHGVLSLRVEPKALRFGPFDPVVLELRLTNVSEIPLAIGPDGPIQPSIAILFDTVNLIGILDNQPPDRPLLKPPPLVVSIDRSFSLAPQQSIVVEVDLSANPVAEQLNVASLLGGAFQVRAVANFVITPGRNIDAGPFGRESLSPVFRIDGLLPGSEDRTEQMVSRMANASTVSDVKDIASLLTVVTGNSRTLPIVGTQEDLLMMDSDPVRIATFDAFSTLPPIARAWVLSTIQSDTTGINILIDEVVADETDYGMAICLAKFSKKPASRAIVDGLASADPRIRRMAEAARDLALIREEREAQTYRLDTE